jgi:thiol:disulfide interchange protein DsbA
VEVIEFFWYGCPHCAKVDPMVEAWEKRLPPDVVFRREHIVWNARPETQAHAQLFVTLRAMGIVGQHQQAVFDAVHGERTDFRNEKALLEWVAKRRIDRDRFEAMYKSFGTASQVVRSRTLTSTYAIEGVPTFIINGKYSTEPHRAGGERQVFDVIDRLIQQERSNTLR